MELRFLPPLANGNCNGIREQEQPELEKLEKLEEQHAEAEHEEAEQEESEDDGPGPAAASSSCETLEACDEGLKLALQPEPVVLEAPSKPLPPLPKKPAPQAGQVSQPASTVFQIKAARAGLPLSGAPSVIRSQGKPTPQPRLFCPPPPEPFIHADSPKQTPHLASSSFTHTLLLLCLHRATPRGCIRMACIMPSPTIRRAHPRCSTSAWTTSSRRQCLRTRPTTSRRRPTMSMATSPRP